MTPLENKFRCFLRNLPESEDIDADISASAFLGRKADHLLFRRKIVIEIKTITKDPSYKISEILNEHRNRDEFPEFFWKFDLKEVLAPLSDGKEIHQKIVNRVTRVVQSAVEEADDQIAATKSALGIHDSKGVLVILNENIAALPPDIITAQGSRMLLKKKDDILRYKHVSYIMIVSEAHRLDAGKINGALPIIVLEGPTAEDGSDADLHLDDIVRAWSENLGATLTNFKRVENFDSVKFRQIFSINNKKENTDLVQHEIWRKMYRERPYLSGCDDQKFIEHSVSVLRRMRGAFFDWGY